MEMNKETSTSSDLSKTTSKINPVGSSNPMLNLPPLPQDHQEEGGQVEDITNNVLGMTQDEIMEMVQNPEKSQNC